MKVIDTLQVGGLSFNNNRLKEDLEERCHMVYTIGKEVYRCCELVTHEVFVPESDWNNRYLYNIEGNTYRYCNQHTIQLKISDDFKGKKFDKI